MSNREIKNLETYRRLPANVRNAASRLAEDMSALTGSDESGAVLEAIPLFLEEIGR